MKRVNYIKLECGVEVKHWNYKKYELIEIDLIDFYNGYGELNNLELLSKLFKELNDKGFKSDGLSREIGYYDSTDGLLLTLRKNK